MESIATRTCLNPQCAQQNPQPITQFGKKKGGRDGLDSWCKPCRNAKLSEWKRSNPEKAKAIRQREQAKNADRIKKYKADYHAANALLIRVKVRQWTKAHSERVQQLKHTHYLQHREVYRVRAVAWRQANPDKVREASRRYHARHPEVARLASQKWRTAHPDRLREALQRWRLLNPQRVAMHNAKRARLLRDAPGNFTEQHVQLKFQLQEGKCYYCGVLLNNFHVEHKITLTRGGTNWPANICCSCPRCNTRKHDRNFWEFLESMR